jgi:hypothetical protein
MIKNYNCKVCNKSIFHSPMKSHGVCSKLCFNKLHGISVTCLACGKELVKYRNSFCCKSCYVRYRLENGWSSKLEMIANTKGKGSRKVGEHISTWRNVDSM